MTTVPFVMCSHLKRVGHGEPHQAVGESVFPQDGEEGSEQDDAVADELNAHAQPPAHPPHHQQTNIRMIDKHNKQTNIIARAGVQGQSATADSQSRVALHCPHSGWAGFQRLHRDGTEG